MAEKRTLTSDLKKNILNKIGKEDITKGDARGYGKQVEGGVSTYKINEDVLPKRPYNVYPKKTKKKPIEDENDFERVFSQALAKAYEKRKIQNTSPDSPRFENLVGIFQKKMTP